MFERTEEGRTMVQEDVRVEADVRLKWWLEQEERREMEMESCLTWRLRLVLMGI